MMHWGSHKGSISPATADARVNVSFVSFGSNWTNSRHAHTSTSNSGTSGFSRLATEILARDTIFYTKLSGQHLAGNSLWI